MKSSKKKKPPTLAEVRRVVHAWVKANWPGVLHAELSANDRYGCIGNLVELVGPPTDRAWFTNSHPETAEQIAEREKLQKLLEENAKGRKAKDVASRMVSPAIATGEYHTAIAPVATWWIQTVAVIRTIERQAVEVREEINKPDSLLLPFVYRDDLADFCRALTSLVDENLTPPFKSMFPPLDPLPGKGGEK